VNNYSFDVSCLLHSITILPGVKSIASILHLTNTSGSGHGLNLLSNFTLIKFIHFTQSSIFYFLFK